MRDYKEMWDNLYKYIQEWNDSIDIDTSKCREIDKDRLARRYTLSTVLDKMMDIEADNAYEIIRCKNCVNYEPKGYCTVLYTAVSPNWYCAHGKRGEK